MLEMCHCVRRGVTWEARCHRNTGEVLNRAARVYLVVFFFFFLPSGFTFISDLVLTEAKEVLLLCSIFVSKNTLKEVM